MGLVDLCLQTDVGALCSTLLFLTLAVCICLQLQSTIREHRDGGNAGGVFSRYNILKVSHSHLERRQPPKIPFLSTTNTTL